MSGQLPRLRRWAPAGQTTRGFWEVRGTLLALVRAAEAECDDDRSACRSCQGWYVQIGSYALVTGTPVERMLEAQQALRDAGMDRQPFTTRRHALMAAGALAAVDVRVRETSTSDERDADDSEDHARAVRRER